MKPPPFEYHAPTTVDEALALLARYGDDAKVIAGGQSLMPMLAMRLARPAALVDLNRIEALARREIADGRVTFGALVRQRLLEEDAAVVARQPLLAEVARLVGHPATRNRGTIAGSIAHGDPAAELPCAMLALEATYTVAGQGGDRTVSAERFHRGALTVDLQPDEILVDIAVPSPPAGTAHAFLELTRRFGDFAIVAAGVLATVDGDRRCTRLRVALAGIAPTPVRARSVEQALTGERLTPARIAAAAPLVRGDIDPPDDVHATREYRHAMAVVFVKRALGEALRHATAGRAV